MKMKLEKGDPCFVRLHTGDVVEAMYDFGSLGVHWVSVNGLSYLTQRKPTNKYQCRFQYPLSEMKRQMRLE